MLELLHDVTANAAAADPAHRPAVGHRSARPAPAQRARGASSPARRGPRPRAPRVDDQLTEIADGIDPAELRRSATPSRTPGRRRTPRRRCERFALLGGELRSLRAYAGEPILDVVRRIIDTTGIDIELASAVSPAAAARRDNLDLFLKAVAEFQAVDGDVTLPGAAGLPDGRGRPGQRPRRRHADRGRLGQAADRAPGQGSRVGLGVPRRGVRDPVPVQPLAHPVDVLAVGAARAPSR